jgi:ketosteroid isomerase-like protein
MSTSRRMSIVIAGLAALVAPGWAAAATEADKAAITAVIEEEKDGYVSLDEARMAATWIQEPSSMKLFVAEGKEFRLDGWAAIAGDSRKALDSERALPSGSRSRFQFSNYRVTVQGDSAWAICGVRWDGVRQGSPASAAQSRVYVLSKEKGRWKIALMAISILSAEKKAASTSAP